ncbi:MAG: hypothetical protein HYX34_13400 [Actinobacteria bacterium]|nr:hypothetical protein [Actinomycetota bacterium]
MGQPIVVAEHPSTSRRGVVRFELNRPLSGMGHERYRSPADAFGDRPVDLLARRLFERGGIEAVHVNSNIVTVDLTKGYTSEGIRDIIENLFRFYGPGSPGETPEIEPAEPVEPAEAMPG